MEISWKNWFKPIARIFIFPVLLFIKMFKILIDLESPDEEERTFQQQKRIEDFESLAVRRSSLDQEPVLLENELEQIQLTENSTNDNACLETAELQRLQTQGKSTNIDFQLSTRHLYSGHHWKVYECSFMKQNCHFQRGLLQYKNATTLLNSSAIHTTH